MTDAEALQDNIVFCLDWIAGCEPDEVIEAMKGWKYSTAADKRDIAISLSAISRRIIKNFPEA
jgi:hypothetical protein